MDLGCLDLGCISVSDKHGDSTSASESWNREADSCESAQSGSRSGKMKKRSQRKTSPLHWFPRRKVDSYLKRKIKMLQETGGMNSTLDETLGDSNPHYCRVLREQLAAREAAEKAMEARKAALVEASWCRILRAARIQSKEAEALMLKAEKAAVEAFEAATAMGVIMHSMTNTSQRSGQIESSPGDGRRLTIYNVTASFETAFEVDKEVAAAVKSAFVRLANCPSFSKDEFKELLRKISVNPDTDNANQDTGLSSEYESESGSELELPKYVDSNLESEQSKRTLTKMRLQKTKRNQSSGKLNMAKLVDIMFERLRCLQEDELSSLATIVATCGLNAALEDTKLNGSTANPSSSASSFSRRMPSTGAGRLQIESEFPSLDRFLVKHKTKLEREVEDAKNSQRNTSSLNLELTPVNVGKEEVASDKSDAMPDLGSVLLKHTSRLEKEIEEAKKNSSRMNVGTEKSSKRKFDKSEAVPDLGSVLVKHSSRLEKEIEEAKKDSSRMSVGTEKGAKRNFDKNEAVPDLGSVLVKHSSRLEKEIEEAKKDSSRMSVGTEKGAKRNFDKNEAIPDLGSVLVKHSSRLEKEIEEAKNDSSRMSVGTEKSSKRKFDKSEAVPDLGSVVVKHSSRLEKEIEEAKKDSSRMSVGTEKGAKRNFDKNEAIPDLGSVLVKHSSRLEKEIEGAKNDSSRMSVGTEKSSKRNFDKVEAIPDLGSVLVKHSSRLEKEIEEAKKDSSRMSVGTETSSKRNLASLERIPDLESVLTKHSSKLEKEIEESKRNQDILCENDKKMKRTQNETDSIPEVPCLNTCLVKHVSKLEREIQEARYKHRIKAGTFRDEKLKKSNAPTIVFEEENTAEKENINFNLEFHGSSEVEENRSMVEIEEENVKAGGEETEVGLEKILVKPVHRLGREKTLALSARAYQGNSRLQEQKQDKEADYESLDKVLVKHVSRLEKEKIRYKEDNETSIRVDKSAEETQPLVRGGLDHILVRHTSRLQKEKMAWAAAAAVKHRDQVGLSLAVRREARERELQEAWGGLSLGNSMRPHLSKLERDKAAWIKAEEDERRLATKASSDFSV